MLYQKKLFLLDAYALIYRAYYAFIRAPRYHSSGLNTSAIFGLANTLDEVLRNEKPTHIAFIMDPPGPTFRHDLFPPYKANREETPEDIKKSIPYIKRLIEAYNIQVLEVAGFEADDVAGTLAKLASNEGFEVYIMSPDKDFCQLVTPNVLLYKPGRAGKEAEVWGVDEVRKSFQVNDPSQVIDILGLWGDSSDNVPGAPGIGEVTSKKLISEFGSIENLYKELDNLKPKIKEILSSNMEKIMLSKKLVTIKQDVPLSIDTEQFVIREIDGEKLHKLYEELEFRTLLHRFELKGQERQETSSQGTLFSNESMSETLMVPSHSKASLNNILSVPHDYQLVSTDEKRQELIRELQQVSDFCFDTETTSLDLHSLELVGISFCFESSRAFYLSLPHTFNECKKVVEEFKQVFENENIAKTGQNIKFDILALRRYGVEVKGDLFDTMLAHYLLEPDMRHNLNYLAEVYLNYSPVPIEELIGRKGKDQRSMRDLDPEMVRDYAAEDADLAWRLSFVLRKELEKHDLLALSEKLEMPLIYVLADMEWNGIRVDNKILEVYAGELSQEALKIEKEIYLLAGLEFNLQSPKQLGEVLFDKLQIIKNPSRTKTKQYSTSEEVLEKISDKHPVIEKILEYRGLKKLISTYVEALPRLIHPKTRKVHTSFNQAIASTGRLSSTNPNLQNIPIREERGREIRKAFIPSSPDHLLLSADYSQIELRLMAHMSKDESMIEAFRNNEDIHTATAAKINHVRIQDATREMRAQAKTANFGIIYGISAFGLSQRLNIAREEARKLIDGYFSTYPGVKLYMEKNIGIARERGFVETIMGRKRHLPDINSKNAVVRGMAERNAINAPIQGSAADIIKLAMINIRNRFRQEGIRSSLVLQVHDELVFDALKSEIEEVRSIVKEEMEHAVSLMVPLVIESGTGENWLQAH